MDACVSHSPIFPEWMFDIGLSAYITNEIGQVKQFTSHDETIRVGGNSTLRSEGIETLILPTDPVCVHICNVLYVPSLGYSLLSWNQLKHKLRLSGRGQYMTVITIDNATIFNMNSWEAFLT